MIQLVANITDGCTASLSVKTPAQAAQYIWDHRNQAESWEITPDEHEAEILREIAKLRGRK